AALTLDEALRLSEQITDLQILLVTNISDGADKIISHPEINQIRQLKGKRIAVEENSVGIYLLYLALQKAQLELDDVFLLPATVNQHLPLMQSRRADAVVTFDPTAYQLEKLGFETLFDSTQIDNKIVDVLVCRKSLITERPQAIKQLLAAYWQAHQVLVNSPQQAYPLIAKRLGVPMAALPVIYQNLILPDKSLNAQLITEDLSAIIDQTGHFLLDQGLLTKPPDAQTLLGYESL
ncbi:MAG TPA: ABC transporter substrate-binding protein, partial [Methylophaga sp.]|nr:ABC transporter substrate-binding protein [Methylophaga sp.]